MPGRPDHPLVAGNVEREKETKSDILENTYLNNDAREWLGAIYEKDDENSPQEENHISLSICPGIADPSILG